MTQIEQLENTVSEVERLLSDNEVSYIQTGGTPLAVEQLIYHQPTLLLAAKQHLESLKKGGLCWPCEHIVYLEGTTQFIYKGHRAYVHNQWMFCGYCGAQRPKG